MVRKIVGEANGKDWILVSILALFPVIILISIGSYYYGSIPTFFNPSINDEVFYWHQSNSFFQHFFSTGYYGHEERIARLAWSKADAHGFIFPAFHAVIAKFLFFEKPYISYVNISLYFLASLIFLKTSVKDWISRITITSLLLIYPAFLRYGLSSMQQVFHLASGILLAAIFFQIFRKGENFKKVRLVGVLFVIFISLFRETWLLLLIPLLFINDGKKWIQKIGIIFFIGIIVFQIKALICGQYTHDFYHANMRGILFEPRWQFLIDVFYNYKHNTVRMFEIDKFDYLVIWQRFIIIGFALVGMISLWANKKKYLENGFYGNLINQKYFFHFMNIIVILFLCLFFHKFTFYNDYRLLAPHVLLSILLLSDHRKILGFFILACLMTLPSSLVKIEERMKNAEYFNYPDYRVFKEELGQIVQYEPKGNPWCNTLLISDVGNMFYLYGAPSGIGLNWTFYTNFVEKGVKSRWFLHNRKDEFNEGDNRQFVKRADTSLGVIYENLESECDLSS